MYLIVAAILCLTAVPVTPSHHGIHKRMSPVQVQQVFGTDHENVPPYKLVDVEISSMQKRDAGFRRVVRINGLGREVTVEASPTDGFLAGVNTPVTLANDTGNSVEYLNYRNVMELVGQQLVNPLTGASLVLSHNRNRRYALDGHIESENLIIRSLPEELVDSVYSNNSNHHVVFEPRMIPIKRDRARNLLNVNRLRKALSRNTGQPALPRVIFPEVLLVVDASSLALHGGDVVRAVRYTLILWNSVDMRYRNLTKPAVRLNIARIIVANQPGGTPYIRSSMINRNTVEAGNVLHKAAKHFYTYERFIPFNSYDVIVAMTRHNLIYQNGEIGGLAQFTGACMVDNYGEKVDRFAIFYDDGSHWSINPAHELAHLLGASHDESVMCSSEDGYIMSPGTVTSIHNWDFSSCSIEGIKNITQRNPQCLENLPKYAGEILPRILMDKSATADKQCQLVSKTNACEFQAVPKEEFCRTLTCNDPVDPTSCSIHHGHNLEDGTFCGSGMVCVRGECVRG